MPKNTHNVLQMNTPPAMTSVATPRFRAVIWYNAQLVECDSCRLAVTRLRCAAGNGFDVARLPVIIHHYERR